MNEKKMKIEPSICINYPLYLNKKLNKRSFPIVFFEFFRSLFFSLFTFFTYQEKKKNVRNNRRKRKRKLKPRRISWKKKISRGSRLTKKKNKTNMSVSVPMISLQGFAEKMSKWLLKKYSDVITLSEKKVEERIKMQESVSFDEWQCLFMFAILQCENLTPVGIPFSEKNNWKDYWFPLKPAKGTKTDDVDDEEKTATNEKEKTATNEKEKTRPETGEPKGETSLGENEKEKNIQKEDQEKKEEEEEEEREQDDDDDDDDESKGDETHGRKLKETGSHATDSQKTENCVIEKPHDIFSLFEKWFVFEFLPTSSSGTTKPSDEKKRKPNNVFERFRKCRSQSRDPSTSIKDLSVPPNHRAEGSYGNFASKQSDVSLARMKIGKNENFSIPVFLKANKTMKEDSQIPPNSRNFLHLILRQHILNDFINGIAINHIAHLCPFFALTLGAFELKRTPVKDTFTADCGSVEKKNDSSSSSSDSDKGKDEIENETIASSRDKIGTSPFPSSSYSSSLSSDIVTCIFFEESSQTLDSWILNLSQDERGRISFIIMLLQVFIALEIAQQTLRFTHYDLHCQNILMNELSDNKIINVGLGNKQFIFNSNIQVKIIDFGSSSVTLDESFFSNPPFPIPTTKPRFSVFSRPNNDHNCRSNDQIDVESCQNAQEFLRMVSHGCRPSKNVSNSSNLNLKQPVQGKSLSGWKNPIQSFHPSMTGSSSFSTSAFPDKYRAKLLHSTNQRNRHIPHQPDQPIPKNEGNMKNWNQKPVFPEWSLSSPSSSSSSSSLSSSFSSLSSPAKILSSEKKVKRKESLGNDKSNIGSQSISHHRNEKFVSGITGRAKFCIFKQFAGHIDPISFLLRLSVFCSKMNRPHFRNIVDNILKLSHFDFNLKYVDNLEKLSHIRPRHMIHLVERCHSFELLPFVTIINERTSFPTPLRRPNFSWLEPTKQISMIIDAFNRKQISVFDFLLLKTLCAKTIDKTKVSKIFQRQCSKANFQEAMIQTISDEQSFMNWCCHETVSKTPIGRMFLCRIKIFLDMFMNSVQFEKNDPVSILFSNAFKNLSSQVALQEWFPLELKRFWSCPKETASSFFHLEKTLAQLQ